MKRATIILAAALLPFALVFLCVSFAKWSINPGDWTDKDRGIVAFIGGVFGATVLFMAWVEGKIR